MEHATDIQADSNLSILNLNRRTIPGPEYLQELICCSCASKNAIEFWSASGDIRTLTYRDLDSLASRLAVDIVTALSGRPEEVANPIVPVFIPQSPELYISWIAILKAGAAFCPVAVDTPTERLKFVLRDVNASLVLTIAPYEDRLAQVASEVKVLDVNQCRLESIRSSSPASDYDDTVSRSAKSMAYVMYTSGMRPRALSCDIRAHS